MTIGVITFDDDIVFNGKGITVRKRVLCDIYKPCTALSMKNMKDLQPRRIVVGPSRILQQDY